MHLNENPYVDSLLEERRYEADFQSIGDSTKMLKDPPLNEEEEIIDTFLSSLKMDHFFDDILGICSN